MFRFDVHSDDRRADEIRWAQNVFKFDNLDPFLGYSLKVGVFNQNISELVCSG